jgi:hypothetical protein
MKSKETLLSDLKAVAADSATKRQSTAQKGGPRSLRFRSSTLAQLPADCTTADVPIVIVEPRSHGR